MCGRFFRHDVTWEDYHTALGLIVPEGVAPPEAAYNIAPTQLVPIVRHVPEGDGPDTNARELALAMWGLVPSWWHKPLKEKNFSTFNARAETVASSNTFRGAFRHHRCLVPASGYYEWTGAKGAKTPFAIGLSNRRWFCFAGLWDRAMIDGSEVDSFTILTTGANDATAGAGHGSVRREADWWVSLRSTQTTRAVMERPCKASACGDAVRHAVDVDIGARMGLENAGGRGFVGLVPGADPDDQAAMRELVGNIVGMVLFDQPREEGADRDAGSAADAQRDERRCERAAPGDNRDKGRQGAEIGQRADDRAFGGARSLDRGIGDGGGLGIVFQRFHRFVAVAELGLDGLCRGEQADFRAVESIGQQIVNRCLHVFFGLKNADGLADLWLVCTCHDLSSSIAARHSPTPRLSTRKIRDRISGFSLSARAAGVSLPYLITRIGSVPSQPWATFLIWAKVRPLEPEMSEISTTVPGWASVSK